METKYPKFSVIIPLKDRAEYIGPTLRTCMIQDYPNFEIIVSDDNSKDNTVEVVRNLAKIDSRIKLYAHQEHLGMRDNFEFALNQVKDGNVIALGGDDGLVPGCIWRMYEIMKETGLQLLTWIPAAYVYSTPQSKGKSIFLVRRNVRKGIIIKKSSDFLKKIAETFNYQIDECPMFYMKGCASMTLVNKVRSRTPDHCFYYCPTPDGFSGVVLAGEVDNYAYTTEPLSISGTTIKSQGQNYRRTDKKSREESEQFFNDNIRRTMHAQLASQQYSPLQTIMTADYLLTAADLPGWPGNCFKVSFENLIRKTFKMLEKSNFDNAILIRELRILREIARQHHLEELFDALLHKTKRKVVKADEIYGMSITHSLRFEGSELGINNIFDASIAVNFILGMKTKMRIKTFLEILRNNIRILYRTRKFSVEKLPQEI